MSKRRGKGKLLGTAIIIALAAAYAFFALSQPFSAVPHIAALPLQTTATTADLPWPKFGQSAVGAVGYGVLATHGAQKPLATASLAKVITALVVLQKYPLASGQNGPTITISQADVDTFNYYYSHDGSVANVRLGEKISERQALEAMLLPSANNMAVTLARWAFGSTAAYNTAAQNYMQELGLHSTTITDPSGFDVTTTSTAHDLTVIALAAMQNAAIRQIVAEPTAKIPVEGTIRNINFFLGDGGIIGIKTGNNDADHGAYLFAATTRVGGQDITVVGAVMGGDNLVDTIHKAYLLIQAARHNFRLQTVVKADTVVGHYTTLDGQTATAVANRNLSLPVWDDSQPKLTVQLKTLHQPAATGQTVGTLSAQFTTGAKQPTTVPIKLKSPLTKPPITWRLTHPSSK